MFLTFFLFHDRGPFHINPVHWFAEQINGLVFQMIGTFVMKELMYLLPLNSGPTSIRFSCNLIWQIILEDSIFEKLLWFFWINHSYLKVKNPWKGEKWRNLEHLIFQPTKYLPFTFSWISIFRTFGEFLGDLRIKLKP